jgi:hypothetical protein
MKHLLHKEVERHFRPEFINRLDDIIVFKTLTRGDLDTIVEYELRKVRQHLGEHHLELELTDEAKAFIIDKDYNPYFGARSLRRAIEHNIEDPVSEDILRGNYRGKTKISVTVKKAATTGAPGRGGRGLRSPVGKETTPFASDRGGHVSRSWGDRSLCSSRAWDLFQRHQTSVLAIQTWLL